MAPKGTKFPGCHAGCPFSSNPTVLRESWRQSPGWGALLGLGQCPEDSCSRLSGSAFFSQPPTPKPPPCLVLGRNESRMAGMLHHADRALADPDSRPQSHLEALRVAGGEFHGTPVSVH